MKKILSSGGECLKKEDDLMGSDGVGKGVPL